MEKVTWHKLKEICADTSQSRSKIYHDIAAGRLIVHKSGKSTLVSSTNRRKYYDSFTVIQPKRDLAATINPKKEAPKPQNEAATSPRASPAIQPPTEPRRRAHQLEHNE